MSIEERSNHILNQHKLRKTRVRSHVIEVLLKSNRALSSAEIEHDFDQVDRITLYRTLKTFEEKGIIHKAIDGSDTPKYAICSEDCSEHEHHDEHVHFHCENCHTTVCLDIPVQQTIALPNGYSGDSMHVVVKGQCNQCV